MKINSFGKSDFKRIIDFETIIGFTLPIDYKDFLINYNGGSIQDGIFFVDALKEKIPLHILYGLNLDRELDLTTWHDEYKYDMLPNCIIIGHDFGSGILVLINSSKYHGIYYWDHAFDFKQSNEENNIYFIAKSFTDFFNMLSNKS